MDTENTIKNISPQITKTTVSKTREEQRIELWSKSNTRRRHTGKMHQHEPSRTFTHERTPNPQLTRSPHYQRMLLQVQRGLIYQPSPSPRAAEGHRDHPPKMTPAFPPSASRKNFLWAVLWMMIGKSPILSFSRMI